MLKQSREARGAAESVDLKEVASLSLFLPARVIVYLTAEIKGLNFWEIWKELHEGIYHDEAMKQYAPDELIEERRNQIETPVPPVRTSDFLRQDNWLTFWDTPEEAKNKPKYFISDDDRLYWWDGSDEVILSEEMDAWLKSLAAGHKELMKQMADALAGPDAFLKEFLLLLAETDQYYQRIFPFQDMFYEFIANSGRQEYQAAVELFRRLAEENREEGGIIKYAKYSWETTSRKVTHNIGRLRLKRYLSVMANRRLRAKYFGF